MYLLNVVPLVYVWDFTVYSAAYGIVTASYWGLFWSSIKEKVAALNKASTWKASRWEFKNKTHLSPQRSWLKYIFLMGNSDEEVVLLGKDVCWRNDL